MKPGTIFENRFRIDREIGRGSFGIVYLAEEIESREYRAIKVLLPRDKDDEGLRHRLKREAQLTQKLKNQHCVKIYDLAEASTGEWYIVMEYLRGQELSDVLERDKRLPADRAVHIARQILSALGEAHKLGIIHRDLKPNNIFLCQNAQQQDIVKVLDFGIAKIAGNEDGTGLKETTRLTDPGNVLGTPTYMSPEQCRGENFSPGSDFYSLGVMLYEMLTGDAPFDDINPVQVMIMHATQQPPPMPEPLGSTPLGKAVMRSLHKDPNYRYASADDFSLALSGKQVPMPAVRQSGGSGSSARTTPASAPSGVSAKSAAATKSAATPKPQQATAGKSVVQKYWLPALIVVLVALAVGSMFF